MAFKIDDLHRDIQETYKWAKTVSPYIQDEGWGFTEDFTFVDYLEQSYIEFLTNMAFSSGELSIRDANAINYILKVDISHDSMRRVYFNDVARNKLWDHTKEVAQCVVIMAEFENRYSELFKEFPSIVLKICDVMNKSAIVLNNTIDDPTGCRNCYHSESISRLKEFLTRIGIM